MNIYSKEDRDRMRNAATFLGSPADSVVRQCLAAIDDCMEHIEWCHEKLGAGPQPITADDLKWAADVIADLEKAQPEGDA
jgi:hypothetical protein